MICELVFGNFDAVFLDFNVVYRGTLLLCIHFLALQVPAIIIKWGTLTFALTYTLQKSMGEVHPKIGVKRLQQITLFFRG